MRAPQAPDAMTDKYDFALKLVPQAYPIGWAYDPAVFNDSEEFQHCSVQECPYKPAYEIYHGLWLADVKVPEGLTRGWWYVCRGHKRWLVQNSKVEAQPAAGRKLTLGR